MHRFRALFLHNRRLAVLLVALALCMKAFVPAGYMLDGHASVLTVHICGDSLAQPVTRLLTIPTSGHGDDSQKSHADSPCQFSGLGHAMLGGGDSLQLLIALAFILAVGFAPIAASAFERFHHLRPPLRGPPARV